MGDVGQLIDHGIKAYVAGRVGEALRAFQEVLEIDPGNPKASSYLVLISGGAAGLAPPRSPAAPRTAVPRAAATARSPATGVAAGRPTELTLADHEVALDDFAPSPWDDGPTPAATFVLEPGGGLDLDAVAEKSDLRPLVPEKPRSASTRGAATRSDVDVWLQAARELFALGDFTGSLELIEKILQIDPDHGEARDYLRQNEATLISMYESKLGALAAVPRLAIKAEEVMWLNLDHRAGFLLAQIDGSVDYEALFALSGLPRLDTARILANLIADGVITG
jgi:tetratricopeptide (TPR) repeat protein